VEPWYLSEATETNQILSSRVRLARNIENFHFNRKLSEDDAFEITHKVENIVRKINRRRPSNQLVNQELDRHNQQLLLESHVASPKFLMGKLPKKIFTDFNQNISLMINEEDHIRIQSVCPGSDLLLALSAANKLDDYLENYLDFSFDSELGYLTACPTNVGTGLRASFMIHLPCLDKTDLVKKLQPFIAKNGLTLRGIYGEGTISLGSIYQISNQVTLGKAENDIVQNLISCTQKIIKRENEIRDKILSTRRNYLQDKVYRAYGVLTHCRRISVNDAMGYLSDIRLGLFANILDIPKPVKNIYQMMIEIQPGHLQKLVDINIDEDSIDIVRAEFLRTQF